MKNIKCKQSTFFKITFNARDYCNNLFQKLFRLDKDSFQEWLNDYFLEIGHLISLSAKVQFIKQAMRLQPNAGGIQKNTLKEISEDIKQNLLKQITKTKLDFEFKLNFQEVDKDKDEKSKSNKSKHFVDEKSIQIKDLRYRIRENQNFFKSKFKEMEERMNSISPNSRKTDRKSSLKSSKGQYAQYENSIQKEYQDWNQDQLKIEIAKLINQVRYQRSHKYKLTQKLQINHQKNCELQKKIYRYQKQISKLKLRLEEAERSQEAYIQLCSRKLKSARKDRRIKEIIRFYTNVQDQSQ